MEPAVLRGRRWLFGWAALLLVLIVATRLAVVFLAINGKDGLPAQLVADAIAVAVLFIALSGDRVSKWLGALLYAVWGFASLYVAATLGAAITFTPRGEVAFLIGGGGWHAVVQALAIFTGVVCVGFAAALAASPSINLYLASRRLPRV